MSSRLAAAANHKDTNMSLNVTFRSAAEEIAGLYLDSAGVRDPIDRTALMIPAAYNVGVYSFNIGTTILVTALASAFFAKIGFVLALGALGYGLRFAGSSSRTSSSSSAHSP